MADKTDNAADDKKVTAKDVAQPAAAATPPVADAKTDIKPVFALHLINGKQQPGTMFRPKDAQEDSDLRALGAVRDLKDAEAAVFKQMEDTSSDPLG
jgi:hypothetical protein